MKRTLPFLFALFAASSVFAQGTVQSGPAYSIPAYGTPGPNTTVGPSNIFTDATLKNVYVPGGVYVAGPNPWIDITQPPYNARAVTSISAATATCNGTTTVSITAGASQFQTNDGIVLEGCGPSVPATAAYQPSSVSVTPVMQSGGDPHYDVASAAAGSTPTRTPSRQSKVCRPPPRPYTSSGEESRLRSQPLQTQETVWVRRPTPSRR